MVSAGFSLQNSLRRVLFLEEIFLLAKISMKMVLGISFLAFSNADVKFDIKKLTWRKYIVIEIIPVARQVEWIDKYKFVEAALDRALKTFVVYIAVLELLVGMMIIHPTKKLLLVAFQ